MKAHCGYCGEEMMGAVNRCWRCGHHFATAPIASGEPPVRRQPISGPLDGSHAWTPPLAAARDGGATRDGGPLAAPLTTVESTPVAERAERRDGDRRQAAEADSLGTLRLLDSPHANRWGTPFHSDFEPTAGDRWRRVYRRLREWIRLVVGDPTSSPAPPNPASGTELRRLVDNGADEGGEARFSSGRSDSSLPQSPLANAAAVLSLVLSLLAIPFMAYPLIAFAMAGLALALAAFSQWVLPRVRTLALLILALAILAANGWRAGGGIRPAGGGGTAESEDFE
jgi:hypothetical protein